MCGRQKKLVEHSTRYEKYPIPTSEFQPRLGASLHNKTVTDIDTTFTIVSIVEHEGLVVNARRHRCSGNDEKVSYGRVLFQVTSSITLSFFISGGKPLEGNRRGCETVEGQLFGPRGARGLQRARRGKMLPERWVAALPSN